MTAGILRDPGIGRSLERCQIVTRELTGGAMSLRKDMTSFEEMSDNIVRSCVSGQWVDGRPLGIGHWGDVTRKI